MAGDCDHFATGILYITDSGTNIHSACISWKVLETVGMKDAVSKLSNKLQEMVEEGGSNFSAGERQVAAQSNIIAI